MVIPDLTPAQMQNLARCPTAARPSQCRLMLTWQHDLCPPFRAPAPVACIACGMDCTLTVCGCMPQDQVSAITPAEIESRLVPCQHMLMKWAADSQNSRNAAAQRAAVYAVQEFWQRAGSPPECASNLKSSLNPNPNPNPNSNPNPNPNPTLIVTLNLTSTLTLNPYPTTTPVSNILPHSHCSLRVCLIGILTSCQCGSTLFV